MVSTSEPLGARFSRNKLRAEVRPASASSQLLRNSALLPVVRYAPDAPRVVSVGRGHATVTTADA
jgi:hypothetical protein